jgi:hypothetical protein
MTYVSEFQKRVLHMLVDLRERMSDVDRRYEPADSARLVRRVCNLDEFYQLEETLLDECQRSTMVGEYFTRPAHIHLSYRIFMKFSYYGL